ncbi:MAG: hypothetical protein QM737_16380 [Ferruginibacter sp.]
MAAIPIEGLIQYDILSNGKPISEQLNVLEFKISKGGNNLSVAEISIQPPGGNTEDFDQVFIETFANGFTVEIYLGYEGEKDFVFSGLVTNHILQMDQHSGTLQKIICTSNQTLPDITTHNVIPGPQLSFTIGVNIFELKINRLYTTIPTINKFSGYLKVPGTILAKPNNSIQVLNAGTTFSENILISQVTHHMIDGNWITTINIGLDTE